MIDPRRMGEMPITSWRGSVVSNERCREKQGQERWNQVLRRKNCKQFRKKGMIAFTIAQMDWNLSRESVVLFSIFLMFFYLFSSFTKRDTVMNVKEHWQFCKSWRQTELFKLKANSVETSGVSLLQHTFFSLLFQISFTIKLNFQDNFCKSTCFF